MKYRGYKVKLSNIYKMERGDKIYSLEISKDGKEIFASDFLYKDEKTAFRDAKSMIRKSTFNTEIIRKNEKKDNIKKDKIYHAKKWNNISNMIILLTNIVTITIFISLLFFVKELSATTDIGALFGILYSVMGLLMVIIMLFWGIFAKGGFKLNEKQRNIYKVVWWMNFFFNNGYCLTVTNPNFKNKETNPDIARYAVFSDGLVVSSFYDENSEFFLKELNNIFPDKNLYFLSVSDECIEQLYKRLPEFQKGASTIYIEMLKQKARKLKRLTGEQHNKMLDMVAREAGWKNWNSIKIENEAQARLLIDKEKLRNNN